MTGPEHYAEAERLLKFIASEQNAKPEQWLAHAALAQVHATLALTAATIETVEARGPGDARAHRRQVLL